MVKSQLRYYGLALLQLLLIVKILLRYYRFYFAKIVTFCIKSTTQLRYYDLTLLMLLFIVKSLLRNFYGVTSLILSVIVRSPLRNYVVNAKIVSYC